MTDLLTHPRLVAGLAIIPTDNGLIVEGLAIDGAAGRRLFTGTAAVDVLPRLLPLLDGYHDVAAIAAAVGITVEHAVQAISLLARSGLLGTGTADGAAETFIDRTFSSAERVRARLAKATVAVTVPEPLAGMMITDLVDSGIGTVQRGLVEGADLTVADDLTEAAGPVLRVAGLEVGPLIADIDTVCGECARSPETTSPTDAGMTLLCSLAVAEVLAVLTGAPTVGRGKLVIDAGDLSCGTVDVLPRADCPRCSLVDDSVLGRLEWLNRGRHNGSGKFRPQTHADLATSPRVPHSAVAEPIAGSMQALSVGNASNGSATDIYLIGAGLDHPIHRYTPEGLIATRSDLSEPPQLKCLPPHATAVAVLVAAPDRWYPKHGPQSLRRAFLAAGRTLARLPEGFTTATWFDAELPDLLELYPDRETTAAVIGFYAEPPGSVSGTRSPNRPHGGDRQTLHGQAMSLDFGASPIHSGHSGREVTSEATTKVLSQVDHPLTILINRRRVLLGGNATASAADFRAACVAAGRASAMLADRWGGIIDDETTAWPAPGETVHLCTLNLPEET